MKRIDLVKLRKRAGMNQRQLAELLQVRPSFLSAIENGRSKLPEEKIEKIKEIFEISDLDDYMSDDSFSSPAANPILMDEDQSNSLSLLLNHFHDLAHQREKHNHDADSDLISRIDFLTKRNDRLSDRLDDLREEIDRLREENFKLKDFIVRHQLPLPDQDLTS